MKLNSSCLKASFLALFLALSAAAYGQQVFECDTLKFGADAAIFANRKYTVIIKDHAVHLVGTELPEIKLLPNGVPNQFELRGFTASVDLTTKPPKVSLQKYYLQKDYSADCREVETL